MAADKESADRFEALRAQAEALIRERLGDTPQTKSDIVELIHELQIQKGELEIQNEELRRVQEESNRLAREWQATFDADNDAVWILDHDQRVLRANKMAEVFFDLTKNEMIGKSCWEIVHGTNKPIPECPCLRSKKSLRRESMELQIGAAWIQIRTYPIRDADGRFFGVVLVVWDITQRKMTEIELERT
ncbi:MAG: PAS domain-containing protein, partial [Deltaproteobacteria bacterium]